MLKEKIVSNIINKNDSDKFSCALGKITKVNKNSYSADVITTTRGNEITELKSIPLPILGNGIHLALPSVGDNVLLCFTNESLFQAKIVCIVDEKYKYKRRKDLSHVSQGTYKLNINIDELREELDSRESKKSNLASCWVDDKNEYGLKYHYFADREPISELINDLSTSAYFEAEEVGLMHPVNKSLVKLKNDGCIDIFTKDNNGIRINPNEKKIMVSSDTIENSCLKWIIEADDIKFKAKNFSVISDNVLIDSENLSFGESKKLSMDETVKEI